MPNQVITQDVKNIFEYPQTIKAPQGNQLSIGDLHANLMLFMHFLVSHGVVEISPQNYAQLAEIYKKEPLEKKDIQAFNAIIDGLKVNNQFLIRLIGDEICDRGQNDYFIFKLLAKLHQSKVNVDILLSNHGIEFLLPYEKNATLSAPNINMFGQAKSLNNLRTLLENKIIDKKELDLIVETVYLPRLKLITYTLNDNAITLYSHAGIGLETIKAICAAFGQSYRDNTAQQLAQTIDQINEQFLQKIKAKALHHLVANIQDNTNPFVKLIWNRSYYNLERPAQHQGYSVHYVHGHDSGELTENNIIDLDSALGKPEQINGRMITLASEGFSPEITNTDLFEGYSSHSNEPNSLELTTDQQMAQSPWATLNFLNQLIALKQKITALRKKGHEEAALCAETLHDTINRHFTDLTSQKIDKQTFQAQCAVAINTARPELEKHRGWKQFLGNLMLAIVGLGVFYVAAGLINKAVTGHFLFFKTDSEQKIDQLEHTLQSIPG